MQRVATINTSGKRQFTVTRSGDAPSQPSFWQTVKQGLPFSAPTKEIASWRTRNLINLWRGFWKICVARACRIPTFYGAVYATVLRADGKVDNYGLVSLRVVTDTGVGYVVDAFQNSVELENMKYHGFGTGTTAEAASQTALVTELTTEYSTNSTRPTGSQTEGATANVYRTVATLTPDSAVAITEHGIFSQAATGGGVMLDRSVFSAINLNGTGDSLQIQYDYTMPSGS
jgi:hypothetical protein